MRDQDLVHVEANIHDWLSSRGVMMTTDTSPTGGEYRRGCSRQRSAELSLVARHWEPSIGTFVASKLSRMHSIMSPFALSLRRKTRSILRLLSLLHSGGYILHSDVRSKSWPIFLWKHLGSLRRSSATFRSCCEQMEPGGIEPCAAVRQTTFAESAHMDLSIESQTNKRQKTRPGPETG